MKDDATRAARLRRHLAAMLENWASAGWDGARSGFHEKLDQDLRPVPSTQRRLLTCARQLYFWSRGPALAGLAPRRDMADAAFACLTERFRDRQDGGFWFSTDLEGRPLDRRKDLYGHAFVLFALAHYHGAFGVPAALELTRETDALLHRRLAVPGGWLASSADPDWCRPDPALAQNPHMHLFEAYLALAAVDADPAWRERAAAMRSLFDERLFDAGTGVLGEFQADTADGQIIEPGHHFEWCWLLHIEAELTGAPLDPAAGRLFDWAIRHGIDPAHGGIYDRVDRAGRVLEPAKRIWPLLEAIKAQAARTRHGGDPAEMRRSLDFLSTHYLLPDGRWHESLGQDLVPNRTEMPGTTPYHWLMTIAEVLPILDGG